MALFSKHSDEHRAEGQTSVRARADYCWMTGAPQPS